MKFVLLFEIEIFFFFYIFCWRHICVKLPKQNLAHANWTSLSYGSVFSRSHSHLSLCNRKSPRLEPTKKKTQTYKEEDTNPWGRNPQSRWGRGRKKEKEKIRDEGDEKIDKEEVGRRRKEKKKDGKRN